MRYTFRLPAGVPEGSYDLWRTVFDGCVRSRRPVGIDMHAKGMDQATIDVALGTAETAVENATLELRMPEDVRTSFAGNDATGGGFGGYGGAIDNLGGTLAVTFTNFSENDAHHDGGAVALESITAIKRAGADFVLTYFAGELAEQLGG